MNNFLKHLILASFLFCSNLIYCQTYNYTGTVTNTERKPISYATVLVMQNSFIKYYTQTNTDGLFRISLPTNEKFELTITSIGYIKYNASIIEIENNKTIILQKQINSEDTVRIVAKKGMYEKGDTIFYNTDVYKRNNENNLKDLINNLPGISVLFNGKIVIDGKIVDKVLIDGKDLTGDNYEKILNNLSPHGIDQIQVLKKYKDPYTLSNSLTGDTEVALNITFKKKKIIPNAKISLGIGMPITYYEQKTDFLILTKPITAINFINLNSIGNTYQLIQSPNSLFGNFRLSLFDKIGTGLNFYNGVNELFLPITKNYYSFNHTNYFDNSSQFNIGKKITNKFGINYTPEKIEQTESSLNQTFFNNQLFSETKNTSSPIIKTNRLEVKNEFIWMLQKNEQIKINSNYTINKINAENNNIINNLNTNSTNKNKQSNFNTIINYTKFLRKAQILNLSAYYEKETIDENYTNDGLLYKNTIFNDSLGFTKIINQPLKNTEINYGTFAKWIIRKHDYSFTIQPTYQVLKGRFYSELNAVSTFNINYNHIDSMSNNFNYEIKTLAMPLRYTLDKLKTFISAEFKPTKILNQEFNILNKTDFWNLGWAFNIRHEFKNKRGLMFMANRNLRYSNIKQQMQNSIIINNTNKLNGTNFYTNTNSTIIYLSSFRHSFGSKKPSFNYNLSYNINTPNFILNTVSNNFYNSNSYSIFNKKNNFLNVGIGNYHLISKINLRLENNLKFGLSKMFNSQNNYLIQSTNKSVSIENKVHSNFTSMFNFDFANLLELSNRKAENLATTYKALNNTTTATVSFNYLKKCILDIECKNYLFYTYNNKQTNNLFFVNISYKQLFNKNKIRLNLQFQNITNRTYFVKQIFTETNYNESKTSLLPFFAIMKIEFLL